MNEILVLERRGDPDDGMFTCLTGTTDGNGQKMMATCAEAKRADRLIDVYLRKTNKSVSEYESTEEVLRSFIEFCQEIRNSER